MSVRALYTWWEFLCGCLVKGGRLDFVPWLVENEKKGDVYIDSRSPQP